MPEPRTRDERLKRLMEPLLLAEPCPPPIAIDAAR
jgi:hypothetical protein